MNALETVRELAAAFPRPAAWHPGYVPIRRALRDLEAALVVLDGSPRAAERLERLAVGEAAPVAPPPGSPLAAARARLQELPRPEGQHPYPDAIRVTLAAAELALDALAGDPDAAALFAAVSARRAPAASFVVASFV